MTIAHSSCSIASAAIPNDPLNIDYIAVKATMFYFSRLVGADPMLGVEMVSVGEVGCFGDDLHEAMRHGLLATGLRFPRQGALLSLCPVADNYWFTDEAKIIVDGPWLLIFATHSIAEVLAGVCLAGTVAQKDHGAQISAVELIVRGVVKHVINIPRAYDEFGRPNEILIRHTKVDIGVPQITDLRLTCIEVEALRRKRSAQGTDLFGVRRTSCSGRPLSRGHPLC